MARALPSMSTQNCDKNALYNRRGGTIHYIVVSYFQAVDTVHVHTSSNFEDFWLFFMQSAAQKVPYFHLAAAMLNS